MTDTEEHTGDWRCHVGRHRYVTRPDDNPEMRGATYLECARCGKKKDIATYDPMPPNVLNPGIG